MGALTRRMKSNVGSSSSSSSCDEEKEKAPIMNIEMKRYSSGSFSDYSDYYGTRNIIIRTNNTSNSIINNDNDNERKQRIVQRSWNMHFLVAILVLIIGMSDNHLSRKYIPVSTSLVTEQHCDSVYLNVMAPAETDVDAIVCCNRSNNNKSSSASSYGLDSVLETTICSSKAEKLPFASRLAKFPEAWLIPLFPSIFRIVYLLSQNVFAAISRRFVSNEFCTTYSLTYTFRRLCLYIILINIRGWILYVFFNEIEDEFVTPIDNMKNCWYTSWLQKEQVACIGRSFDFSDHIVLYYAQILPIPLIETLYGFQFPYWNKDIFFPTIVRYVLPIILGLTQIYIQYITTLGAYKTAAYFHTPNEVIAGFIVSLIISYPLYMLQCNPKLRSIRTIFFRYNIP